MPARSDPCWNDPDWRAAKLHECVRRHGLEKTEIAQMTGNKPDTVRFWLGNYGAVVGANTLFSLILQLNARVS